ncbi:fatty acid hydroxylase [Mycobacteroides sp. H001]|uniref:sterol desaturase family protein n=1 Tax=Mycobacteroides TaxID=670516 RepID=UPI0007163DB4|nr:MULTISPECIES: sterol desaturase family protein [Mycobacteroides]KRQ24890.1 fatty acid hydroxylase [Mycobacteroides sp. H072]KRQ37781.1 fatty acid hydroxylase [Mycobacteroides sp. H002]KRQ47063.1 fatty acid hydroxylase [Mycobacteroides sp. H054]KRQ69285.1 fatty acid hydroxylase [Mycobacteroides sp. H001]OHU37769.1 fatty acid hydroxylase [Mycobacteroides chelonae]
MTRAARKSMTLRDALVEFVKHPTPWMLVVWSAAQLGARLSVGGWTIADAITPVVLVAISPIAEWLIHVGILHWRPRSVGPVKIDSRLARDHRLHHQDPRDIPLVFIPWPSLVVVIIGLTLAALFAFPRTGLGLTFALTVALFLVFYEWTHYLVHTDYKPRHTIYRAVWRNHRYHHFKNENYWFTVTSSGTADRLLGTYPDPQQVQSSPTVRNLHASSITG